MENVNWLKLKLNQKKSLRSKSNITSPLREKEIKRIKFVEWCASLNLWPIVWLHYCIVIKLYYGIVYGK